MAKSTVHAADRAAAGQPVIEQTAVCELGRHHVCRGRIVSLTASNGRHCQCSCHDGDDLAVEAALEREHFYGDLFDYLGEE